MRICRNDITDHIREHFGANPVRIPESRIQPLGVLEIRDNQPKFLGTFPYLVKGDFPYDIPILDSRLAEVSDVKTKKVEVEFGFRILDNFLKAFSMDPAAVGTAIKNTQKLAFSFSNVHRKYIDVLQLGKILSENDIYGDQDNFIVSGILRDDDLKLGLITDVMVSNNFSFSTYRDNESASEIDIPLIQEYVSDLEVALEVKKTSESEVKFEGREPLTFAFSCVEITIDPATGKFSRGPWLDRIRSSKGTRSIAEPEILPGDWEKFAKMEIDSNRMNPLLLEL